MSSFARKRATKILQNPGISAGLLEGSRYGFTPQQRVFRAAAVEAAMFRPGSDTKELPQTAHLLPGQLAQVCERSRPLHLEITGKERTVAAAIEEHAVPGPARPGRYRGVPPGDLPLAAVLWRADPGLHHQRL